MLFFLLRYILGRKNIDIICDALLSKMRLFKNLPEKIDLGIRKTKNFDFFLDDERRLLVSLLKYAGLAFKAGLKPEDYALLGLNLPKHNETAGLPNLQIEEARIIRPDVGAWKKN